MYHIIEQKVKCSKCNSENIAKPANDANWIYKCLDCGHAKIKEEPKITMGSYRGTIKIQDFIKF